MNRVTSILFLGVLFLTASCASFESKLRARAEAGEAWALVPLDSSKLRSPTRTPHIVDIVPTVCKAVGVDHDGLSGVLLLEKRLHTHGLEKWMKGML